MINNYKHVIIMCAKENATFQFSPINNHPIRFKLQILCKKIYTNYIFVKKASFNQNSNGITKVLLGIPRFCPPVWPEKKEAQFCPTPCNIDKLVLLNKTNQCSLIQNYPESSNTDNKVYKSISQSVFFVNKER